MYADKNQHLFKGGDLGRTLDTRLARVDEELNNIPKNQFLYSSDQDIIDHLYTKLVINPIELHHDLMEMYPQEIQINHEIRRGRLYYDEDRTIKVPGNRITVTIPYSGEHILWKLTPSRYSSRIPLGVIRTTGKHENGFVDIIFEVRSDVPPEQLKNELDRNISLIKEYLADQLNDINQRNEKLPDLIRKAIIKRRDRLEKQEGLVKQLNIPLKSRDGVPPIRPFHVERRIISDLPKTPGGEYKPEWGISDKAYEDILSIIRHEGRTFETTPFTYTVLNEEDLRNIILAHLNGHYKGRATGETFRKTGKTDIRIEMENRAAFIAECKLWRGPQELLSAVDQLLGYLVWYDCKTSLVVFNKNNLKFNELLEKLPSTIQSHPNYLKSLREENIGEWKYKFASLEDEARQIIVHVFLFNLYVKQDNC
jgi:hypothetical protein